MLMKIKDKYINIIIILVIFCLAFIITMQSPLNIFSNNLISGTDSSVFRTIAYYMCEGLMPYKDIFDHKGPILYIINYIGMLISYNKGIWLIELLSMFITLFFMYKTSRFYCNKFTSLIITALVSSPLFIFFEGGNLTEEYALPFIAISIFIFIDYLKNNKINIFRLIICGVAFGCVCLLRINMITIWLVFCITIFIKELKEKEIKQLIRYYLYFILGLIIVLLPVLIWLIVNDAFLDFIDYYITFNLQYTSSSSATLSNRIDTLSYFVTNDISLLVIAFSLFNLYKNKNLINVSYMTCLLLTFIFISISGRTYFHYGMILIPMFIYPLASFFDIKKSKCEKVSAELIIIIMFFYLAFPNYIQGISKVAADYNNKILNINNTNTTLEYSISYDVMSNSNEDDKITVFGNSNIIYILSHRMSSSKYTYQFPIMNIDKHIKESYFEDLYNNKPKIIVKAHNNEELDAFIKENNYSLISSYPEIDIDVFKIS